MKVEPGTVILIPVDGVVFACKIIWVSKRSRDVIGLVVLPGVFDDPESVTVTDGDYQPFTVIGAQCVVLYADRKNITRRKLWPVIGALPMTERDDPLLIHQVGGGLWQGDQFIRNLQPQEPATYPKMLVAGNLAVEIILRQLIERGAQACGSPGAS